MLDRAASAALRDAARKLFGGLPPRETITDSAFPAAAPLPLPLPPLPPPAAAAAAITHVSATLDAPLTHVSATLDATVDATVDELGSDARSKRTREDGELPPPVRPRRTTPPPPPPPPPHLHHV